MTVMVLEVYDALRSAGADEDKARRAAEAMARDDRFDRVEQPIEKGHALSEARSAKIGERFAKIYDRLTSIESRMTRVEARAEYQGKMLNVLLGVMIAILSGTILLLVRVFVGGVS